MIKRAPDDLDADPILIPHRGRLAWLWPSGRILFDVSGGDGDDDEKKFTQTELDRIVQDRLARVKTDPPADYEALKAAKTELDALKAQGQSDIEKLQTQLEKVTGERDAAVQRGDAAETTARDLRVRQAVTAAAAKLKAVDPDDVFALLPKDKVTIADDGQVTGADDAVKALLEAKPHLVGDSRPRPKPDPAQGGRPTGTDYGSAGRAEAQKRFGKPAGSQAVTT